MKIFLSWSGNRSKSLALALREWLPHVIQQLEPWCSDRDIEAADRPLEVIARELNDTSYGIFCINKDNQAAPWINFEAGAIAKSVNGKPACLLMDLEPTEIKGPLGQFQMKECTKNGILDILKSINKRCEKPLSESHLTASFERCWNEIEPKISLLKSESQQELIEEIKPAINNEMDFQSQFDDVKESKRLNLKDIAQNSTSWFLNPTLSDYIDVQDFSTYENSKNSVHNILKYIQKQIDSSEDETYKFNLREIEKPLIRSLSDNG